jgi:hypothetical protein
MPGSVYVADESGIVAKVILDGGTTSTLAGSQPVPFAVAADSTYAYWTNAGAEDGEGSVMRVPIDGGIPTTLASGLTFPSWIAVDNTSVYFILTSQLVKLPIAGGPQQVLWDSPSGGANAGIALDDKNVFWVNEDDGTVMKISKSGGCPTLLASGETKPVGIAVDSRNVYWTTYVNLTGSVKTTTK